MTITAFPYDVIVSGGMNGHGAERTAAIGAEQFVCKQQRRGVFMGRMFETHLYLIEYFFCDNWFMVIFDVILWQFTIVDDTLLGSEVDGVSFL